MAIYHLEAKVVGRGAGRSAVAASAYLSCSRLYNDYDGIQHDYTKKQGLVWQEVFLPEYAPQEWQDREKLWNAVEEVETAKDSRLAREFVVALPIELSREQQIELLQDFIREQFVSDGMCADAAIHDTDGHNPHAHILLTVRPLDERGKWQYKTEKEYLCMRNGEERGFTAAEFKSAQNDGWEKQYPYKVGKKKVYMTPSAAEAQELIRADKHPKSTPYGRQNPISERWNSEEQLVSWRVAWADVTNRYLESAGREERIDHRSNAARGLDEIPTIHEGVTVQALERKGIVSDRCEMNRQIRADNALLRELKAEIKKLAALVARTVPAIAEGLEKLRSRVLIFCYQLSHIRNGKSHIQKSLAVWKPELERYTGLVQQIKEKSKERKTLVAEKKALPIYHVKRHKALAVRIAELTEDLEELRSEKALLFQKLEYAEDAGAEEFRKDIATMEAGLKKLEAQEQRYSAELDKALAEYAELKAQASDFDSVELYQARQVLRPAQEKAAERQLEETLQKKPSLIMLLSAKQEVSRLLGEDTEERQARQMVIRRQRSDPQKPKHFQR
jgi:ATP-dependent exoDNAse (exonuclease V) alpha subunit